MLKHEAKLKELFVSLISTSNYPAIGLQDTLNVYSSINILDTEATWPKNKKKELMF